MRLALAPAAVLLLLLAGCAAPAPPPAEPSAEASVAQAWALDLRQADCEALTWSVPVPAASLQPHLPEGFEPSPPEGQAGLGGSGAATLAFRAVECVSGLGEGLDLRSVQSGHVFTPVVPPAELRDDRFGARYAFGWDALAAPAAWRAAAQAWELPVHDGGALVGPGAQGWTGALAMDRVGSFGITGRGLTPTSAPSGGESRLVTLGAQGFALWDTTLANVTTSSGVGVWEASPESWVAQVLGATTGLAPFDYTTFDVPAGLVHWPGQALPPVESDPGIAGLPSLPLK